MTSSVFSVYFDSKRLPTSDIFLSNLLFTCFWLCHYADTQLVLTVLSLCAGFFNYLRYIFQYISLAQNLISFSFLFCFIWFVGRWRKVQHVYILLFVQIIVCTVI